MFKAIRPLRFCRKTSGYIYFAVSTALGQVCWLFRFLPYSLFSNVKWLNVIQPYVDTSILDTFAFLMCLHTAAGSATGPAEHSCLQNGRRCNVYVYRVLTRALCSGGLRPHLHCCSACVCDCSTADKSCASSTRRSFPLDTCLHSAPSGKSLTWSLWMSVINWKLL